LVLVDLLILSIALHTTDIIHLIEDLDISIMGILGMVEEEIT